MALITAGVVALSVFKLSHARSSVSQGIGSSQSQLSKSPPGPMPASPSTRHVIQKENSIGVGLRPIQTVRSNGSKRRNAMVSQFANRARADDSDIARLPISTSGVDRPARSH
jgi:hypothetical protein